MIQLNKVLVPTDFSDFSKPAITYGCAIAEKFGAELHLLNVVPDQAMLVPEVAAFSPESMMAQSESLVREARRQLAELPASGWQTGKPVIREVRTGPAAMEIIDYATKENIDMVVIGTHGRSGLMHILMGSIAERVVRLSPCPVLTVKPQGHQFVTL